MGIGFVVFHGWRSRTESLPSGVGGLRQMRNGETGKRKTQHREHGGPRHRGRGEMKNAGRTPIATSRKPAAQKKSPGQKDGAHFWDNRTNRYFACHEKQSALRRPGAAPHRRPVLRYRPGSSRSTAQNKPAGLMTSTAGNGKLASVRGSVTATSAPKADNNGAGSKHGGQRHHSVASQRSRPGTRRGCFQDAEEPLALKRD